MKTPSQISLRLINRSFHDHLTVSLLLPHFTTEEDLDYETYESGIKRFRLSFDTGIHGGSDRDHWSFGFRVLGFGFTLTRQWGY